MASVMFPQVLTLLLARQSISSVLILDFLERFSAQIDGLAPGYANARELLSSHFINLPPISKKEWDDASWSYEKNLTAGVTMISIGEGRYPSYLRRITDAPAMLFVRGNQDIFDELPGIAIVGAREASDAGKEIAKRIAMYMAERGWPVVSGLALGIDAAAHRGALDGRGKTIAVLAGGLDKPNPAANSSLGFEILEKGGAWISEHPVGTPPRKHHFVPRNRIQVGLSAGSIIVEAKIKSGSLTQARFCVGQDRPLFAVVPHAPENPLGLNCEGTIHMVQELSATPVRTKDDYFEIIKKLEDEKAHLSNLDALLGPG
jgi:DNA processing protein